MIYTTDKRTSYGVFSIDITETSTDVYNNFSTVKIVVSYASENSVTAGIDSFGVYDNMSGTLIHAYQWGYITEPGEIATISELEIPHDEKGYGSVKLTIQYHIGNATQYTNNFIFDLKDIIENRSVFSREEIAALVNQMATVIGYEVGGEPVPWAFYQFPIGELAKTPFLIYFYDDNDDFIADNVNYATIENLVIELYTEKYNPVFTDCVEVMMNWNNMVYSKSFSYLESEEMYLIRYESEVLIYG